MGNCLRSPRNVLDPILMSDDSPHVAIGPNQPLQTTPEVWRTEVPWTEGQLRGKRDTFWETAPAYDGRREIWDALKAACEAAEEGDYGLAQVILDGANISLPTGRLVEAYDELGNRYVLPKYCISRPSNLAGSASPPLTYPSGPPAPSTPLTADTDDSEIDSGTNLLQDIPTAPSSTSDSSGIRHRTSSTSNRSRLSRRKFSKSKSSSKDLLPPAMDIVPTGDPVVVKIRVSSLPKDIKMTLQASDRVRDLKRRLEAEHEVPAGRITMLYSGRVLHDRTYIKQLDIPKGFIIQAIVN